MKQFTYLKYFYNNKRKVFLTIISVALAVSSIIFISSLFKNVNDLADGVRETYKTSTDIVRTSEESLDKSIFIKNSNIKNTIMMSMDYLYISTLLGSDLQSNVYYMDLSDIKLVLEKENYLITSGKMPTSNKEILLSEEMAKYYGLKVGDELNAETIDHVYKLGDNYTISGLVKGDYISFVPVTQEYLRKTLHVGYKVIFDEENRNIVNQDIENYGLKDVDIKTYEGQGKDISSTMYGFNIGFLVVAIIIIVNLTLSLSFFSYVKYNERLGEFGILKVIGFSRKRLVSIAAKEITVDLGIAFLLGIIIVIFTQLGLNILVINTLGLPSLTFGILEVLKAGIVPVTIALTSILAVSKLLKNVDVIELIEGKV